MSPYFHQPETCPCEACTAARVGAPEGVSGPERREPPNLDDLSGEELRHWAAITADRERKARMVPVSGPEQGAAGGRVVRHPNGHLMVERVAPYVPTEAETARAFESLAKAWPILAQHAPHIDGEFDLALTDLRRMVEALRAALRSAPPTNRES